MSKFTKGKWEVDHTGFDIEITCGNMYLASLYNLEYLEETEANARLITAAPEMYELLKEIKEQSGIQCDMDCDKTGKAISRKYRIYLSLDLYNKIQPLLERIDEEKTT